MDITIRELAYVWLANILVFNVQIIIHAQIAAAQIFDK
jgi:hypothetical protein